MKQKLNQIRLNNLELLISEAGSAVNLARVAGTNSSYLSQVRNQLLTKNGTPRAIGDDLADKLEKAMKKPQGWMHAPHGNISNGRSEPTHHNNPNQPNLLPLISWAQAGNLHRLSESAAPEYSTEQLPCPVKCSPESYVLRVHGSSMEPKFLEDELIFVDPKVPAVHGKFVIVRLNDSKPASFKQLLVEQGHHYLQALNPDWPNRIIEVDDKATICGVVVFKGEVV